MNAVGTHSVSPPFTGHQAPVSFTRHWSTRHRATRHRSTRHWATNHRSTRHRATRHWATRHRSTRHWSPVFGHPGTVNQAVITRLQSPVTGLQSMSVKYQALGTGQSITWHQPPGNQAPGTKHQSTHQAPVIR